MDILSLLREAKANEASDVQLAADSPPMMRVFGRLRPMEDRHPLSAADIRGAFIALVGTDSFQVFGQNMELDIACTVEGVGRLRCNVAKQEYGLSLAIRLLPPQAPTIDELELPPLYKSLAEQQRGLVIVSGPIDSGKSTSLAAMINHLNRKGGYYIVTVEDPIEYIHHSQQSAITQRQVGRDTSSYAQALKYSLRQNPDVILVGEMRDAETAAAVLSIAETGRLVLTTSHAASAPHAVERIIDLFPQNERDLAQARLSSLLLAILVQLLVPRADGAGRVAAVEILLNNSAVANVIREGKLHYLANIIRTGRREGMASLDEALLELYQQGVISGQTLVSCCRDAAEVNRLLDERQVVARPGFPVSLAPFEGGKLPIMPDYN